MEVKYFKTEELKEKISKEEAFGSADYFVEAFYDDNDKIKYSILYVNGKKSLVIYDLSYHDNKEDKILSQHHETQIKIVFPPQIEHEYRKVLNTFYSKNKEKEYSIIYWFDLNRKLCTKEEYLDKNNQFSGGQRFYFNDYDELTYSFEYDEEGMLLNCYNFSTGSNINFENILINSAYEYEKF